MRDEDELRAVQELAQNSGKAADVGLVERRIDFIQDAKRTGFALKNRQRPCRSLQMSAQRRRWRPRCYRVTRDPPALVDVFRPLQRRPDVGADVLPADMTRETELLK